jgi:hypothetical protein
MRRFEPKAATLKRKRKIQGKNLLRESGRKNLQTLGPVLYPLRRKQVPLKMPVANRVPKAKDPNLRQEGKGGKEKSLLPKRFPQG